jgi:hypothetical protein
MTTRVFGRTLPSIRDCELWEDWQSRDMLPSAAIVTDIGNDIMYGSSPRQISQWVQECAERLVARCERVVVTGLPLDNVTRLGPRRFKILRAILFPSSQLTLEQAIDRAIELNERVSTLAKAFNLEWTSPDPSWFGIDPIHIRRRHWSIAWEQMMHHLREADENTVAERSSAVWKLRRLRAKHCWLFGVEKRHAQPVWSGSDGSCLSLY